jgi:hypothetical protein
MRFQILAARLGLALLMMGAALAAFAIIAVRLAAITYPGGLALMAAATGLGLTALVCALAWMFRAFARNQGDAKRIGLVTLLGSLAFLWTPMTHLFHGMASPAIHDAASDPENPPAFVALAKLRPPGANSPAWDGERQIHFKGETNTVAYMLHTYYGTNAQLDITKPYAKLLTTQARMFWHAFETAKKMGWTIIDYSQAQGRIEATDTSFWFGQKSDIAIRVTAAGSIGAKLDVRSQDETGDRDFGTNIRRIKHYYDVFHTGGY